VAGDLAELTLKQVKVGDWILLGMQIEVVPELSDFLVEETNCSLGSACGKWTEDKVVYANILRFKTECTISDQAISVIEDLEGDWLVEWIAQRDLGRCSLTDESLEVNGCRWARAIGSYLDCPPHEALLAVLKSDGRSVHSTQQGSDRKIVIEGLSWLDLELFGADSILEICPNCIGLVLVGGILDFKLPMSSLSCLATEDDVVFSQRLFSNSLQFIFILLLRGLILESKKTRGLAYPLRPKRQLEVLCESFLDEHLTPAELEVVTARSLALLESCDNFPFLTGVVHDRDLLRDLASCWHTEFKLGLDLLRNCGQFILVQSDVSPVQGLEDHVASIGGWFCWVAGQVKDVWRLLMVRA